MDFFFFGVPVGFVVGEEDGEGDVVGVFFDDLLQAPAVGVLLALFVEVDEDGGAGYFAGGGLNVEAGFAVGGPAPRLVFSCFAGDDFHAVGDCEDAVKAYAELADEVRVFFGVAGELGKEVFGAGAGDGAEVGDEIFLVHADAGVGYGEGLVLLVEGQVDARVEREGLEGLVDESEVAQLVECVRGVGD